MTIWLSRLPAPVLRPKATPARSESTYNSLPSPITSPKPVPTPVENPTYSPALIVPSTVALPAVVSTMVVGTASAGPVIRATTASAATACLILGNMRSSCARGWGLQGRDSIHGRDATGPIGPHPMSQNSRRAISQGPCRVRRFERRCPAGPRARVLSPFLRILPRSPSAMTRLLLSLVLFVSLVWAPAVPAAADDEGPMNASTFAGLEFRELGPAINSGRIGDIAVDPTNDHHWIVAVASGGVWKTENAGTTWTPVFDEQSSYSIGCVTFDPSDPLIVWVGTGENNSQRSVAYGDGVYKSIDGGLTWRNVGLENSEHIGDIVV